MSAALGLGGWEAGRKGDGKRCKGSSRPRPAGGRVGPGQRSCCSALGCEGEYQAVSNDL